MTEGKSAQSLWWRDAAVYQVYPRSFLDGNGDGLGDLQGVIKNLPYVKGLGFDAIWLSPFYPSPQHDSGYDVSDPRGVDPMYGTLEDAERLIAKAHELELRIIIDIVPNHVSTEHRWFQEALQADPGSPARGRFHFRDGRGPNGSEPPTNWMSMFGGSAWTQVADGQWYLHLFDVTQPDLNWANPEVRADGLETLRFWLDRGVDGIRIDVALGLAKDSTYPDLEDAEAVIMALRMDLDDGSIESSKRRLKVVNSAIFDRDEVIDIYREWRALMNTYGDDRMAVAEAWLPPERASRYIAPDALHQIFNFDFMAVSWNAKRIADVITSTFEGLKGVGATATWALSNHDTPRVASRLGAGEAGLRRARALALIAHALPGAIYVFQGEELGLFDVELEDSDRQDPVFFRTAGAQRGRDGARVPMPWSGDRPPFGFTASNRPLWLPQPDNWADVTAAAQEIDQHSTLHQYRQTLSLRRGLPAEVSWHAEGDVFTMTRGVSFACIANTGSESVAFEGKVIVASQWPQEQGSLKPDTAVWVRLS